jgi:hypothetical protein
MMIFATTGWSPYASRATIQMSVWWHPFKIFPESCKIPLDEETAPSPFPSKINHQHTDILFTSEFLIRPENASAPFRGSGALFGLVEKGKPETATRVSASTINMA